MATFSVTIFAKEKPAVLARVIGHYLRLDAERVVVFHDGPETELAADAFDWAVLDPGRVDLVFCDDAFWRRETGGRSPDIQM